ncbi:hypothetical protein KPSB59_2420024 [Klebsiella quasipneumoniae subsp. quasipneumoniae]|nr:hypothetical protein KPSB59_2420024 [Klebsiella quasipneumoniae subsp. quasipneumoniae]
MDGTNGTMLLIPAGVGLTESKKPAQVSLSGLFKFGSSDWTRTSDIRINSPPFYRLNYRGIV